MFIGDVWLVVTVCTIKLLQRRETERRFEEVWDEKAKLGQTIYNVTSVKSL